MLNPKLKEGDRIVLIYLDDPYSHIPVGTKGTVVKIQNIPFPGKEDYNYIMKWDNGSTLALEPDTDSWILEKDTIKESVDKLNKKLIDNEIEVENLSDLISKLDDDKVTDLFLRNLDRKLLKGGDKTENVRKYISKYIDSLQQRTDNQDSSDDFDVEDEFVYGGLEPEKSAIGRKQFKKELIPLQVELLKLQEHVKRTGKPVVIILEGRDSAGKGSTIRFLTEYLDPKFFKVVALGIDVNKFEQSLVDKGMKLFKFWLSITPQTQKKRFELRKNSPLKYWKFSPNDEKSIDKWDDYTKYKEKVLKQTRDAVPWTVVDTNDKHAGVLNLLRHLLTNVEYPDKDLSHIGDVYPEVVTTIKETR